MEAGRESDCVSTVSGDGEHLDLLKMLVWDFTMHHGITAASYIITLTPTWCEISAEEGSGSSGLKIARFKTRHFSFYFGGSLTAPD